MTKKVFNMAGGLHSAAAYSALENRAYGSCAASLDSFACSAGAGMTIKIAAGDGLISTTGNFARRIQSDAEETVNVSAASPSYSRIDAVVAYIDNSIAPTTSVIDNTNGILNFACVAGTAASSPVAPTAAAIQAAIGAGNDYVVLYEVTVPSGATSMNNAVFNRKVKTFSVLDLAMIPDKLITGAKIADNTIMSDNIDFTTLGYQELRANKSTGFVGSAYTKLIYDNVLSEQGEGLFDYDTTTGVITATKACMINLSASIYPASAYPACLISVYKGDTPSANTLLARAGKANGDYNGLHLSISIRLNAGDKLCLDYYCNASVSANQLGSMIFVSAEQRG